MDAKRAFSAGTQHFMTAPWLAHPASDINGSQTRSGTAMNRISSGYWKLVVLLMGGFCLVTSPCFAAGEQADAKGATVTVLKAARHCFDATVDVSGILLAKDETMVRPDRPGLKVAEILVDAGETVVAGPALA